jgi:hypothetical protein
VTKEYTFKDISLRSNQAANALKSIGVSMAACRRCAAGDEGDDHKNADGEASLSGHVLLLAAMLQMLFLWTFLQ